MLQKTTPDDGTLPENRTGDSTDYTLDEHRHRFAVWAAACAYRRGGSGGGYTYRNAKLMLETAGVRETRSVQDLPEPDQIDAYIDVLIHKLMAAAPPTYTAKVKPGNGDTAKTEKVVLTFICTYGRAAKLVNIYLKSKLICGNTQHDDIRLAKLHPPLDRELLNALDRLAREKQDKSVPELFRKLWAVARTKGDAWTEFDKPTYEAYIAAIKALQGGLPLWAVEKYWKNEE
jgi:hypothetical protein